MNNADLLHYRPTLNIVAEELRHMGIDCRLAGTDDGRAFRGVRPYGGSGSLKRDVLYVLDEGEAGRFPAGEYACVSARPVPGGAGWLECPGEPPERMLDALLELFGRFQDAESRLDELVYRNAGLDELCETGEALLENAICIHDDWFVMVAHSRSLTEVMKPDYIMASSREFIPRIVVEDFKNDTEYLETYAYRTAQLWESSPGAPESIYVNLWEGEVYRGRLLVVRHNRAFHLADYRLAEVLAQRAMRLLDMKRLGVDRPHRGMDDIVFDILQNNPAEPREVAQLLRGLNWDRSDRALCVRMKSQQPIPGMVMDHALHSDLFRVMPNAYIMMAGGQQCILLNLTRSGWTPSEARHNLAPLCRDYCMYAGLSSTAEGVQEWPMAWQQAGEALDHAFRLQSDRWLVSFSDCALEYVMRSLPKPMQPIHLVDPAITALKWYDREKGTQYYETLRAFLLLERDIPRTSERLIIHRTTLLYRLRKMREIVSLDLDDPWKRLRLLLSLWILEGRE